ncbi:hypothetical protein G6F60_014358 [Rhizopus arrhizus]|nr:hypothetical protein G6F60_014358 [Rhizopus arrhizus]
MGGGRAHRHGRAASPGTGRRHPPGAEHGQRRRHPLHPRTTCAVAARGRNPADHWPRPVARPPPLHCADVAGHDPRVGHAFHGAR